MSEEKSELWLLDEELIDKQENRIAELEDKLTQVKSILGIARCPNKNCNNKGTIFYNGNVDPCQWCDERTKALNQQEQGDE